jgi:hypothetical protein
MNQNDDDKKDFQVVDKRQFTPDGDVRPDAPPATEPPPAPTPPPVEPAGLPPASIAELIFSLATSASIYLGDMPNPASGKTAADLPHARHYIDLLIVLEEKTRGNLPPDEEQLLRGLIAQLQLRFVELSQTPPATTP